MIQAIETRYKGYRFRSRLEARWAVFFDALRLPWEYEKEGYNLGVDGLYLPDFWMPSLALNDQQRNCGLFIEIKGEHLEDDPTSRDKPHALGRYGMQIVVFYGMPEELKNGWVCDGEHEYRVMFNEYRRTWYLDSDLSDVSNRAASLMPRAVTAARSARFEHGERP